MLFKMFTLRIYIGFRATKLKVVQHECIIMTLLVQCNKTIQMMQLICIFCWWCFDEITSRQFACWELKHPPQSPICVLRVMRASSSASEFYNVLWGVFEMSVRACLQPLVVNISARRCRLMWLTLHRDPGSWVLLVTTRVGGGGPAVFNFKMPELCCTLTFLCSTEADSAAKRDARQTGWRTLLRFAVHTHWLTDELIGFVLNQPFWLNH